MKKHFSFIVLVSFLFSCQEKDNGELEISALGWLLIIMLLFFLVKGIISNNNEKKATALEMKEKGMSISDFTEMGTYAGGHPEINQTIEGVFLREEDDNLAFYTISSLEYSAPKRIRDFYINKNEINNVSIEDATSIERKVTVGRLLLVGIFALGWKKKKTHEQSFVVIEWKRGKFEHSTIFSFDKKEALQKANTARNKIIKICS